MVFINIPKKFVSKKKYYLQLKNCNIIPSKNYVNFSHSATAAARAESRNREDEGRRTRKNPMEGIGTPDRARDLGLLFGLWVLYLVSNSLDRKNGLVFTLIGVNISSDCPVRPANLQGCNVTSTQTNKEEKSCQRHFSYNPIAAAAPPIV